MSTNFTGITFAQQKVLPSDDAIIRRNILSDGVLYGCELSYSGSTLTMAAGQLLVCGRQLRHPTSQNWAVVDATSGYARLLLTVDLTRTSTKEAFEQVVDSIEYAAAEDGFPELEQSDVNVSGSRYQVVACVVSLGTGGITGIVSQLAACEVIGGAGSSNFKVVGGVTLPSDPAENTIWVNTDEAITSWIFSAEEPAPAAGMVWITTSTSSAVSFNALKKNGVMVYPLAAKQYIGGEWVSVTAKSYQNGKWNDWWNGELYVKGNEYAGWSYVEMAINATYPNSVEPSITRGDSSITITGGSYVNSAAWVYDEEVDLTDFDTLTFDGTLRTTMTSFVDSACINIWSALGTYASDNRAAYINYASTDKKIDVSGLRGKYRIGLFVFGDTSTITMNELRLT